MNHTEIHMKVSSWIDGELSHAEAQTVREHMKHCPDCRRFAGQVRMVRKEIRQLDSPVLTKEFSAHVAHQIEKIEEEKNEWMGIESLARNTVIAIALMVLIVFLFADMSRSLSPEGSDLLISETRIDSLEAQVLLQPGDLTEEDLLGVMMNTD